jgi:hypothetical protein
MPTTDGFDPDHTLPLFLSDEPEQQDIGQAWDRAVISSRFVKAAILVATATAVCTAISSVGDPVKLFAEVPASLVNTSALPPGNDQSVPTVQATAAAQALPANAKDVEKSALQPGADQSMPTLQSTAVAQALPPSSKEAQIRDEIAVASQSADQSQTENSVLPSESLFRLFQAWADEKDAQAQVGPVQSVQDAPTQVVENVVGPAPLPPKEKHGHVGHVDSARAEIRHVLNPRKKARQAQGGQVPRPQDAGAVQNARVPSLLQTFGWRN